MTKTIKKSRKV